MMNCSTHKCPKCGSHYWDWANIGFTDAKQCTDCGEIYLEKESKMKTLLSNINHAIRNNETVSIGGGTFEAHELYKIIQLYNAAQLAEDALLFDYGGEPLPSLEKEALDALRLAL